MNIMKQAEKLACLMPGYRSLLDLCALHIDPLCTETLPKAGGIA
jgi:hypothetical protein